MAGGSGSRMGANTPKQFLPLKGRPILFYTLEAFHNFDPEMGLILVLPADAMAQWHALVEQHQFSIQSQLVEGGAARFHSVKNGLNSLQEEGIVGVHDGVRPLVSQNTLERAYSTAGEQGSAIPVIAPVESIRMVAGADSRAVNRDNYRLVQTPQCFTTSLLRKAYLQDFQTSFTDDASVVEAMGETVTLVEGNRENLKITTPEDLKMAEVFLS